jgi:hypothetical protein
MELETIGLEDVTIDFDRFCAIMEDIGFVLAGQWDYERVTFDRKIQKQGEVFYLRVQAYAVEGEIDSRHAVVKIITPLLGKHYYPHGVEYGEGEDFPADVVSTSKNLLSKVSEAVQMVQ